ncbi:ABC transporter substrate-binding protein [Bradyrhizobium diazoefficiens]|nr:ABC transporter substrate-binding protein [Bradyrhizobium diazoefficiens]QQN66392.1 ABC transporter substrate-binding protein [Bradyrhizobium diazoefficiens]
MKHLTRREAVGAMLAALAVSKSAIAAEDTPGITSQEIKIGEVLPLSGPVSSYGVISRAHEAYFTMINEKGGVNGRQIKLIAADDAYSRRKPSSRPAS